MIIRELRIMEGAKAFIEQQYEAVNQLNLALSQKIKQLTAIQETSKAILSVPDLDRLLSVIMNILCDVCRINHAVIMRVDKKAGHLEYIHSAGFEDDVPDGIINHKVPLCLVDNIISRVAGTGRSEYAPITGRPQSQREYIGGAMAHLPSEFVVPLITRSKVIGVIAVDAADATGVPEETRNTLEFFAPQIAIAIQNATFYKSLREQMVALKQSHTLLKRAEKLSYLGNLAARLAHEIKNPMTAITTFMQMLPEKYDDEEFRKDFYAIAMEETHRINNLVNELLDLAGTRESHFESADLHDLIRGRIRLLQVQSKSKNIRITQDFDANIGRVVMDFEKINQVIYNILANAVAFTPEGGKIEVVTVNHTETGQPGVIRIIIKDNGPGVDPSLQDKIFDPYFSTRHKSDIHSGTGLGLFIAQENMADHGGSIEVSSRLNAGATFTLTLPNPSENPILNE